MSPTGSPPLLPGTNRTTVAEGCRDHHTANGTVLLNDQLHTGGGREECQLPAALPSHGHLLAHVGLDSAHQSLKKVRMCHRWSFTVTRGKGTEEKAGERGQHDLGHSQKRWARAGLIYRKTTFLFDLPFLQGQSNRGPTPEQVSLRTLSVEMQSVAGNHKCPQ